MLKDRKELEQYLVENIQKIKRKRSVVNDIKLELAKKHDILAGDIQEWLNNPEEKLPELDIRELYLFTEQLYLKTGNIENLSPDIYFTEIEKDMARKYTASLYREKIDFPITLPNARVEGDGVFSVRIDIHTINELVENQLLIYDYEIQREAVLEKGKDGSIRKRPKLVKKNVEEIEEHLLNGTLAKTTPPLVWNALIRSSDSGNELEFNPITQELTINKGCELAIGDGFHRITAIRNALLKNKDIEHDFIVIISNFSKKKFRSEQAQVAKATPISTIRVQEWESKRYADTVVQQLKLESDLKDRISQTNRIKTIANELVSYNVMADTIDEEFIMNTRADAADVGDYLVEFFNMLIGTYQDEFINNLDETRKKSLMVDNNFFIGYIVLARRMFESKMNPKDIRKIMRKIDFSRNNPLWVDLKIVDSEGRIERDTIKLRRNIKKYFNDIDIEEMVNI